ncbi:HlyD family efflux transporter periplasmic adaptor subunit [Brevibacillus laterosporus]|uniref:HlyD family efflux transporter periplasmic adaptor subunit n=1 Tax=Brevibacillus laterosporus TaxID=1465 RepID=UPI000839BFD2|nr:HlyD family efflux transporter periplasmic adaptor subunit [Brevibacillus laterosporus]
MAMKKKVIISAITVLVLAGGGYGGYKYFAPATDASQEVVEPPALQTVGVDMGEVKKTVYSTGTVEATARQEVKPDVSGKVESLVVKVGQHVKKGDLLFTMEATDTGFEIEKQKLSMSRMEKEIKDLKARKDRIEANAGGVVKEISVKRGDSVSPETVIAKVNDPNYLKITGYFSPYEAELLREGQKVKVFLPSSMTYVDGEIDRIDMEGTKQDGKMAQHAVDVLVKNSGALYVNDLGSVEYTDAKGLKYASQGNTPFTKAVDIEILAGTTGKVGEVLFKKGDTIKKNQLLAKMDREADKSEIEEKELNWKEAQLGMDQKMRDLSKRRVVAPISGEITKLNVKVGEALGSDPAAIIMDTSSVTFKAAVDELDFPQVKVGQNVDVFITAFGTKAFKGTVTELPKEGSKQDKSVRFEVKIAVEDSSQLKHGMSGDCDIYIHKKDNALRLPANAVEVMEEGKATVMVKDPSGNPMPKDVGIGIEGAEYVEIVSGLKEGDEVVLTNGEGM